METVWNELASFSNEEIIRIAVRIAAAVLFGAMIGYEREAAGKAAGFRTHILVTLGATLFVLAGSQNGMDSAGLSRVIQGIITGIGFIGAGSILKGTDKQFVKGLTTSAGIWMAAAIGVTVGLGSVGLAFVASVITLVVLRAFIPVDDMLDSSDGDRDKDA